MNDVSEKNIQEKYFNQYRGMIENAAWKASRIFRMDVEDLRAQAYLVFVKQSKIRSKQSKLQHSSF